MSAIRSPAWPGRSRIYEKIIRELARDRDYESFAELVEAVKCRCARLRVAYTHGEIDDAVARMGDSVLSPVAPARRVTGLVTPPPLTHAEAVEAIARYKLTAGLKSIPDAKPWIVEQVEHVTALRTRNQGFAAQLKRCLKAKGLRS